MASLASKLLLLGAAASSTHATAINAWWNGYNAQIILQNATTNQIRYSACNSEGDPKYSYTDGSVLSISHKPRVGTPLAGTGWWDNSKTMYAQCFGTSNLVLELTCLAERPSSTLTTRTTSSTPCSTAT